MCIPVKVQSRYFSGNRTWTVWRTIILTRTSKGVKEVVETMCLSVVVRMCKSFFTITDDSGSGRLRKVDDTLSPEYLRFFYESIKRELKRRPIYENTVITFFLFYVIQNVFIITDKTKGSRGGVMKDEDLKLKRCWCYERRRSKDWGNYLSHTFVCLLWNDKTRAK
jgi:hypothetical protein